MGVPLRPCRQVDRPHAVGHIVTSLCASAGTSPEVQRANIIVTNMSASLLYFGALIVGGVYDIPVLLKSVVIVPLYLGGLEIGKRLFRVLPSKWFARAALGLLLITGVSMLARW